MGHFFDGSHGSWATLCDPFAALNFNRMCILIYLICDTTIIKNDDSSLCYDVIITHQKFCKLTNLVIFRVISIIRVGQTYLEMLSSI